MPMGKDKLLDKMSFEKWNLLVLYFTVSQVTSTARISQMEDNKYWRHKNVTTTKGRLDKIIWYYCQYCILVVVFLNLLDSHKKQYGVFVTRLYWQTEAKK